MKRIYWLLIILVLSVALLWQAAQVPPPKCDLPLPNDNERQVAPV